MNEKLHDAIGTARTRNRLPNPARRRLIREQAGLTQQELADVLGVTRAALSRWETGERAPRSANCIRYVDALERLIRETR